MSDTTDLQTERQSVRDIIREFLALPVESLPSAKYIDDDDGSDAWPQIRDYMLPECSQEIDHDGQEIRLHADRPVWSGGVTVYLV